MTFKRGKMSGPGWGEEADGGALVDARQVQVGAKERVFWMWVVVGRL